MQEDPGQDIFPECLYRSAHFLKNEKMRTVLLRFLSHYVPQNILEAEIIESRLS
jgi:hypothetical protein